MTSNIVQHNDQDRNDYDNEPTFAAQYIKPIYDAPDSAAADEARSFLWTQPLDPTLEARVEASGLCYMLLRRAERAERQLEVQMARAEELDQGCSWLVDALRDIEHHMDGVFWELREIKIIAKEQAQRAETAEQRLAGLDARDHALQDMRSANGKLIKIQRRLEVEMDAKAIELNELYELHNATVDERDSLREQFVIKEAELVLMGQSLGVAERERKLAEYEASQAKRAISRYHLLAQRWEAEAIARQTEVIKLRAALNNLATEVMTALEDDMTGDADNPPHPDVAHIYNLAYGVLNNENEVAQ